MAYVKMTLSPGSGRPEIDEILRCPSFEQKYIQSARNEYYELLRTEVRLAEEDQNMYKSIYQKNKSIDIESYKTFGEELRKKYPESCLAFLICQSYIRDQRQSHQIAMVEYNILKEASLAYYAEMTRESSQTGFRQAQYAKPSSSSHSTQHSRLSSFASKQLTEGNPDFTDLSDMNRPDKMAERFHKIYDDEWTTSFESLTKGSIYLTEEQAILVLMDIIKSSYAFCTNYAEKQTKNMVTLWRQALDNPFTSAYTVDVSLSSGSSPNPSKAVVDEFKQYRKSFHKECVRIAIKNFKENVITKIHQIEKNWLSAIDTYVDVCVEVLWLMSVQNPPMSIEWPEPNSPFNNEKYKEYCKKGKTVKLAVWPAVFLYDKGPLINKGYAITL